VRQRGTSVERALRSALHRRGLRFRVQLRPLPRLRRTADIVFVSAQVAVYVDGCFWHRCPQHGTSPKNNAAWWQRKLDANVKRDRDTDERMNEAGWLPIRVWEHEDIDEAATRISELVRERQDQRSR
jgi:DNA mismatch endonuclease (patch repair protein)